MVELSKRISVATRDTDLLVRWGGEEFVLVARVDTSERMSQLAGRIVRSVNGLPFDVKGHEPLQVTCTVGAVKFPFVDTDHLDVWTRLISLADAGLYHGKALGRNGWVIVHNRGVDRAEAIDEVLAQPLAGSGAGSGSFPRNRLRQSRAGNQASRVRVPRLAPTPTTPNPESRIPALQRYNAAPHRRTPHEYQERSLDSTHGRAAGHDRAV